MNGYTYCIVTTKACCPADVAAACLRLNSQSYITRNQSEFRDSYFDWSLIKDRCVKSGHRRKEELMKKVNYTTSFGLKYDLSTLHVRKPGPGLKSFGDVIKLDPDVAGAFPNADAVNEALRFLIRVTKENQNNFRSPIVTRSGVLRPFA